MKIPSLMKINKHKRFNFEPRYYDPIKERIDEKIEQARRENSDSEEKAGYSARISEAFHNRQRKAQSVGSFRLVFILVLAAVFGTYVLYGEQNFTLAGVKMNYGEFAPFLLLIVAVGYIFVRLRRRI